MKTFLYCAILLLATLSGKGQLSVSYFPFVSVLQVGSGTEKVIWGDCKLAVNTSVSSMDWELSPKWNFHRSALVNWYLGAGASFNLSYIGSTNSVLNGYLIDFGSRLKPFTKYPQAQIVFELSPYVNRSFDAGKLRARLGVSWNFSGSKQKNKVPLGATEVQ